MNKWHWILIDDQFLLQTNQMCKKNESIGKSSFFSIIHGVRFSWSHSCWNKERALEGPTSVAQFPLMDSTHSSIILTMSQAFIPFLRIPSSVLSALSTHLPILWNSKNKVEQCKCQDNKEELTPKCGIQSILLTSLGHTFVAIRKFR